MNKKTASVPNYTQKYLMEQAILVIKDYSCFGLSKVKYVNENQSFMIDTRLISNVPINEKTISIQLLGGKVDGSM